MKPFTLVVPGIIESIEQFACDEFVAFEESANSLSFNFLNGEVGLRGGVSADCVVGVLRFCGKFSCVAELCCDVVLSPAPLAVPLRIGFIMEPALGECPFACATADDALEPLILVIKFGGRLPLLEIIPLIGA